MNEDLQNSRERFLTRHLVIHLLLILILCSGFSLRILGNDFGLPFSDYADEGGIPHTAAQFLLTGDWNPHYFNYPPLMAYTIAVTTQLTFPFVNWKTRQEFETSLPAYTHQIGRYVSAVFGTAIILLVFLVAQAVWSSREALIAAFFMAIHPTLIFHSHLATVDNGLLFWILFSSLFFVLYVKNGKTALLLLGCLGIGCATAMKYNALFLIAPWSILILLKSITHKEKIWSRIRRLYHHQLMILFFPIIIFFILAPYSIVDFDAFREGVRWEFEHQQKGHAIGTKEADVAQTARSYHLYLKTLVDRVGMIGMALFLFATIFSFYKREWSHLFILTIPLIYLIAMGWSRNAPERYVMVLYPFVFLFMARAITHMVFYIPKKTAVIMLLPLLLSYSYLKEDSIQIRVFTNKQTPAYSREWFFEHIPDDVGRAADIYAGIWISGARSNHYRLPSLAHRNGKWYHDNDVDFFAVSDLIQKRDEARFAVEPWRQSFYRWLITDCYFLKKFTGRKYDLLNPEISIYCRKKFSPDEGVQTETVHITLDGKPARRFNVLWDGYCLHNGNDAVLSLELPLLKSRDKLVGIVHFPSIDFDVPDMALELKTTQPAKLSIEPITGRFGPNRPFVFSGTVK